MLRTLLLELAKSSRLRRWITSNGTTRRLARRFVPGEDLALAIEAARNCNRAGMTVSLDHLGENVLDREDAERARAVVYRTRSTASQPKTSTRIFPSS